MEKESERPEWEKNTEAQWDKDALNDKDATPNEEIKRLDKTSNEPWKKNVLESENEPKSVEVQERALPQSEEQPGRQDMLENDAAQKEDRGGYAQ